MTIDPLSILRCGNKVFLQEARAGRGSDAAHLTTDRIDLTRSSGAWLPVRVKHP